MRLLCIVLLSTLLYGCSTTNSYESEHWPYQGKPTIGTNAVPHPEY